MPVRERLLLLLLDGEIHDLVCAGCGSSLGSRRVSSSNPVKLITQIRGS